VSEPERRSAARWHGLRTGGAVWLAASYFAFGAQAAERSITVLPFPGQHQLGEGAVLTVAQDARGFLWLGSSAALYRYDGTEARRIAGPAGAYGPITALAADDADRLWVGALTRGLFRLDLRTEKLEAESRFTLPPGANLDSLLWVPGSGLWVGSSHGVWHFDPATGASREALRLPADGQDVGVRQLAFDGESVWAASAWGLYRLALSGEARRMALPGMERTGGVVAVAGGEIWVGGPGLLLRGRPETGWKAAWSSSAGPGRDPREIIALARDARGQVWAALRRDGLLRVGDDGSSEWLSHLLAPAGTPEALASLFIDRTGLLWIGAYRGGLAFTDSLAGAFRQVVDEPETGRQPLSNSVAALAKGEHGELWLGFERGGLRRWRRGGRMRESAAEVAMALGISREAAALSSVEGISRRRAGGLWVGIGSAVLALDAGSGHLRRVLEVPSERVLSLHEDRSGKLWAGHLGGLSRFDPATGASTLFTAAADSALRLPHDWVTALLEDRRGRLWIGTSNGLAIVGQDGILRLVPAGHGAAGELSNDRIRCLFEAGDGTVWVGTQDGLNRSFEPEGSFESFGLAEGLPGAAVFSIAQDARGVLWLGTGKGLVRFDPGRREMTTFSHADGLRATEFYRGAAATLDSGELVFGALEGLTVFDPDRVDPARPEAPVVFTAVQRGAQAPSQLPAMSEEVVTSQSDGSLTIRFSSLDFFRPEATARTRYRLLGLATMWHECAECRNATFTHLPPGSYSFQVQASDRRGRWSANPAQLRVRVKPHWWRTNPMLFLYSSAVVGLVAGGFGLQRRQLRIARRHLSELRERDERIQLAAEVLDSMREAVAVVDADHRLVAINPAFSRTTGHGAEVLGEEVTLLDSPRQPLGLREILRFAAQTGHWSGEFWQRSRNGEDYITWLQIAQVPGETSPFGRYVAVFQDITDRKLAEQQLTFLARHDPLTGLPNRLQLGRDLADAIQRAREAGGKVALLFLDLDRFKIVNDSFGHEVGDGLLCEIGPRLLQAVPEALLSRFAGDEFTLICERINSVDEARARAGRILAALAAPFALPDGGRVFLSGSIGVAVYPDHASTPLELLRHADEAMYHAKESGSNEFTMFGPEIGQRSADRAALAVELRRALEEGDVQLACQPILNLQEQRVEGAEVLLRFRSLDSGEVPAHLVIDVAEETGQILQLGEAVLKAALGLLMDWRRQGFEQVYVSVNVSPTQFLRGDFAALVEQLLAACGAPADRLQIEITENSLMNRLVEMRQAIERLRQLGVKFAMDDFGKGHSSLSSLRQLPVDCVKMDREFFSALARENDDTAITWAILTMAHSLKLRVVAEGVERPQVLQLLRSLGCDAVQGFAIAHPMSPGDWLSYLRTHEAARLYATARV